MSVDGEARRSEAELSEEEANVVGLV